MNGLELYRVYRFEGFSSNLHYKLCLGANPRLQATRRPLEALLEARRRSMRDAPTPDLRLQSSSDFNRIYITDFALGAILRLRATRRPLES